MSAKPADARTVALALLDAALACRVPLDQTLEESRPLATLSAYDRGFTCFLTPTVPRRLGEIDDLLA